MPPHRASRSPSILSYSLADIDTPHTAPITATAAAVQPLLPLLLTLLLPHQQQDCDYYHRCRYRPVREWAATTGVGANTASRAASTQQAEGGWSGRRCCCLPAYIWMGKSCFYSSSGRELRVSLAWTVRLLTFFPGWVACGLARW